MNIQRITDLLIDNLILYKQTKNKESAIMHVYTDYNGNHILNLVYYYRCKDYTYKDYYLYDGNILYLKDKDIMLKRLNYKRNYKHSDLY